TSSSWRNAPSPTPTQNSSGVASSVPRTRPTTRRSAPVSALGGSTGSWFSATRRAYERPVTTERRLRLVVVARTGAAAGAPVHAAGGVADGLDAVEQWAEHGHGLGAERPVALGQGGEPLGDDALLLGPGGQGLDELLLLVEQGLHGPDP